MTASSKPDVVTTDVALQPPPVRFDPGARYAPATRRWQGIASIERAANGRLWATWYTGGKGEDNDNYALLVTSDDDGATWSEPKIVIDPPGMVRAWDPCIWHDPTGRMWWTWTQTCPMAGEIWDGRGGVWAMTTEQSGDANPTWSEPRRLCHGVAINKPIITADGTWTLPVALWWNFTHFKQLNAMRRPGVVTSTDCGATWQWRGGTIVDDRLYDEPMIVQLRDGTLWMLIRTLHGISESFSMDGGHSWSRGRPSRFAGPSSRFHLRRLASGRLLLINHLGYDGTDTERGRSHLTAMLSEDDGATWPHRLLLDERFRIAYPDAVEGPPGQLRIIYDRNRHAEGEILMARINERDILEGRCVSPGAKLRMTVNLLGHRAEQ